MGDSRILQHSSLFDRCERKKLIHPDLHLIGDGAYPLKTWLMKNFARNSASADQRAFNAPMNSARSRVEHAHGMLKQRWRRLELLDFDIHKLGRAILCCALLHNVCLRANDLWTADDEAAENKQALDDFDEAAEESSSSDNSDSDGSDSDDDDDADAAPDAKAKRNAIMRELIRRKRAV